MIIKNKYENKCIECNRTIKIGTDVDWEKDVGIKHIKCPKLKNYSYIKLLKLKKCQECKVKLEGDTFISDSNRLCMKCWENTFTKRGWSYDEV